MVPGVVIPIIDAPLVVLPLLIANVVPGGVDPVCISSEDTLLVALFA